MKKIMSVTLSALAVLGLASCGSDNTEPTKNLTEIEDSLGRKVQIDKSNVDEVVCIGAGSLRLYTYVVGAKNLVGVEDIEKSTAQTFAGISIPYKDANQAYFDSLESCGMGGPKGQTPETEKIISCAPDIVISMLTDSKAADDLQSKIGVPVVCLSYGSQQVFNDNLTYSINLLGSIFGYEKRSAELVGVIDGVKTELNDLTKDIAEADKKSVYLGCLGNYGTQDIYSSVTNYSLFDVANIKNVLDKDHDKSGYITVDKEALIAYNPDKIILDASGISKFAETYRNESALFDSLDAFKNNEIYLQMPYNAYYTNIETALIDAYYSAIVAYNFNINIEEKANSITKSFIGKEMYSEIKAAQKSYGGYQKINSEFIKAIK